MWHDRQIHRVVVSTWENLPPPPITSPAHLKGILDEPPENAVQPDPQGHQRVVTIGEAEGGDVIRSACTHSHHAQAISGRGGGADYAYYLHLGTPPLQAHSRRVGAGLRDWQHASHTHMADADEGRAR